MLHYDRINVSDGIDVNKSSASKECFICYYWYFLDKRFTFQSSFCNRWHEALMMSIDINSIAISNIHGVNYCRITDGNTKSETTNLSRNTDLSRRSGPS